MKILIAGDYCPRYRVSELIENGKFDEIFHDVKSIADEADYSVVNFECPVVMHQAEPIVKQGPNLRCTEKGVEAIKYAGFDCVTLANNHFYDYGEIGVEDTLKSLNGRSVESVGGGKNLQEASKILYKEIKGVKLAIINCCEHEFSIATENTGGSNPLNPIRQFYTIQEAKQNADKVLVIVHGGHEHYQLPSPRMVETYRFFVDAGADAVVNHHQHCFSGYETYKGKPIFYGLGNFCFDSTDQRNSTWNQGYMVSINFKEGQDYPSFELYPYNQCDDSPNVRLMSEEEKSRFDTKIAELNKIIGNGKLLQQKHKEFMDSTSAIYKLALEPYAHRFTKALYRRGLLPSSLKLGKILPLMNYLNCESHYDRLNNVVKQLYSNNNAKGSRS